ncbi:small multi-drug export protein [Halalkalibacter krulwichiae]|uniref:Putative small multi-drug export protein n=1 Tax=Halalkalibacter krulwichiae TaxID=199441 RepID=A0A1X9MJW9_9BACI|nr:small multi-drug export protein [Halalkalibacter krulwichiae]ARK32583.1 Putative small multi-drug export protein [Halalkalibacter krulwichiae]
MLEYLWLSLTAWFMGFFPLFEIYIAIPSTIALGLDATSAIIWSCLGNFIAIPFVVFFYDSLSRIKKVRSYLGKLSRSKFSEKMRKGSFVFILVGTPIVGSWAVGAIGKVIGLEKRKLFLSSAVSICVYGVIIGVLTKLGVDAFFLA